MDCQHAQTVSMMIDGELSELENQQISNHLLGCDACRQTENNFRRLRRQIKEAGENCRKSSAESQIARIPEIASRRRRGILLPFPVFALVLTFIAVLGAIFIVSQIARRTAIPPAEEAAANRPKADAPLVLKKINNFSLASFDHGGRAEIQIVPHNTREAIP